MAVVFKRIEPTVAEVVAAMPGDDILPDANVVMDRAFTLRAAPSQVWPWLVQLGKNRAGWYLPRSVENFIPTTKRALWKLDHSLLAHTVGDIIDDWGGKHGYLELAAIESPVSLVYISTRGNLNMTWVITLAPEAGTKTRVHLRLRLGPVRQTWITESLGGFFDALTVAGLAAGLEQRLSQHSL